MFLPTARKKNVVMIKKNLKFKTEGQEFEKKIEITRTIHSNSKRSEQFLVTECFFSLFLEVSQI